MDSGSSSTAARRSRASAARSWWSCPATSASAPAATPASSGCASLTALVNPDVTARRRLRPGRAGALEREALLAPRLLGADGRVQDSAHPARHARGARGSALPRPLLPPPLRVRYEPWRGETAREVGWAIAACMAARSDLLRRLGPFDPEAFLFYEDMELLPARAPVGGCRR